MTFELSAKVALIVLQTLFFRNQRTNLSHMFWIRQPQYDYMKKKNYSAILFSENNVKKHILSHWVCQPYKVCLDDDPRLIFFVKPNIKVIYTDLQ